MVRKRANDEVKEWATEAFSIILGQSVFANEASKKKLLDFLMTAPDSIKCRVADFVIYGPESKK